MENIEFKKYSVKDINKKIDEFDFLQEFDEQVLEWVDSGWEEEGYESEYEKYVDQVGNEAEDETISEFIRKELECNINDIFGQYIIINGKKIDLVSYIEEKSGLHF